MRKKFGFYAIPLVATALNCVVVTAQQPIWQSSAFSVFADSIVQDKFVAKALSPTEIVSNYVSPANLFKSNAISFKFSINGKDNEMLSGTDHHFVCDDKALLCETPLIKFGTQLKADAGAKAGFLQQGAQLKIKVDMRHVLNAFSTQGFYTTFNGDKIYKGDFKGLYVAGSSAPLIWDFDNLVHHADLQLKDNDGDGIYELLLTMNVKEEEKKASSHWRQSKDLSAYPLYKSPHVLSDAIYNLSMEEMVNAIEKDSTLRTGKEWAGVWTRDVSYSIILAMAHLQPQVAKNSLLRKVAKKKRIVQDTGTGGAWPASTDRMVWAIAAYEIYKVTGDKDWLQHAFEITKNSIDDDLQNIYDQQTGLVKGESSFLDWREQTYPKWMQPADIFESECLGTNAVHYQANRVLSKMASLLQDDATKDKHEAIAKRIKLGINKYLWIPEKKYYGQYLYGRTDKILSPRAEALGEALCILFDIADESRQKEIVANTPVTAYGVPCIFPQIPNIPPYHNNGIWPFVQAYWLWAAAKKGNEKSAMESIAAIYRPAALFATNKENFVAENGDYSGTQINSSNMLWSLSGNISIIHKVFFGIRFDEDGLAFEPFVPRAFAGKRTLSNFKYRGAILNIEMNGYGNKIKSILLDGKPLKKAWLPNTLKGNRTIKIELLDAPSAEDTTNLQPLVFSPAAPIVTINHSVLSWPKNEYDHTYKIIKNGKLLMHQEANRITADTTGYNEYQVIAVDKNGVSSFTSEPLVATEEHNIKIYNAEEFTQASTGQLKGFTGKGFVEISTTVNTNITIPVTVEKDGLYLIDCRYANGNGPTNTENKCAIRNVSMNGKSIGTLVFPQRGKDEWSNWGFTNAVKLMLAKGKYQLAITYLPQNENMNGEINQAMIDFVRIRELGEN